jgi:hypothetical protein
MIFLLLFFYYIEFIQFIILNYFIIYFKYCLLDIYYFIYLKYSTQINIVIFVIRKIYLLFLSTEVI